MDTSVNGTRAAARAGQEAPPARPQAVVLEETLRTLGEAVVTLGTRTKTTLEGIERQGERVQGGLREQAVVLQRLGQEHHNLMQALEALRNRRQPWYTHAAMAGIGLACGLALMGVVWWIWPVPVSKEARMLTDVHQVLQTHHKALPKPVQGLKPTSLSPGAK